MKDYEDILLESPSARMLLERVEKIEREVNLLRTVAIYAKALFSEEGAFEAVSHFNVAFGLKDALAKLGAREEG